MISITILTKNSEQYLKEVLNALQSFNEVLIFDNGSSDKTIEIAQTFSNVIVYKGTFEGFGKTHNKASSLAKNNWILSIDSDEVVSDKLVNEILSLSLDPKVIYSIPRHNYYNGKWIKGCGWYPDRVRRLYNREETVFSDDQVHESLIVNNLQIKNLKGEIKHYSYSSTEEFLQKMQNYSTLYAKQNRGKKKSSFTKALLHGFSAFFLSYIFKKGIFDGKEGFIISLYNANTTFYKYLKLYEIRNIKE